jgi:hypothetical protein
MPTKEKSRRQELMDRKNDPEVLDPTPIEIPADAVAGARSVEDMIQEQIAIQIAKKKSGV